MGAMDISHTTFEFESIKILTRLLGELQSARLYTNAPLDYSIY